MIHWEQEPFELINEGLFQIVDAGPLHAPVRNFSIRRDEKLRLILETHPFTDAKASTLDYPPGTLRRNNESVKLVNVSGVTALLSGVQSYSVESTNNYQASQHESTEKATIHRIDAVLRAEAVVAYTIDWLENVPTSPFIWPDSIKTVNATSSRSSIGVDGDGIVVSSSDETKSFSRAAVRIEVAGVIAYLCALRRTETSGGQRPGCIIYVGAPDEEFREKVRNALAFALSTYLIDLGATAYTNDWAIQSFRSKRAYSIDGKVFDLPILPPSPLGLRWQYEIDNVYLNRMLNAIFDNYDQLNFRHLSWAYWHALCATPHIAGVHFGAAIEALQRKYIAVNPSKISTKIVVERIAWTRFSADVDRVIDAMDLPNETKSALHRNVGKLNQVPQRMVSESVLRAIDLELSPDEVAAWQRRNDAAHGLEMELGSELSLIKGTRLLKVIFHRILLRIINGSDLYYDYGSLNFPIRRLREPASPPPPEHWHEDLLP